MRAIRSRILVSDFPVLCEVLHKMKYIYSGDNVLFDDGIDFYFHKRRRLKIEEPDFFDLLLDYFPISCLYNED